MYELPDIPYVVSSQFRQIPSATPPNQMHTSIYSNIKYVARLVNYASC